MSAGISIHTIFQVVHARPPAIIIGRYPLPAGGALSGRQTRQYENKSAAKRILLRRRFRHTRFQLAIGELSPSNRLRLWFWAEALLRQLLRWERRRGSR